MPSLSVLLPLTETQADLPRLLSDWSSALREFAPDFEILLIDDRSYVPASETWPRGVPGLRFIHHTTPLGLGGALQTGLDLATKEWILATAADRTFAPTEAKKLLDANSAVDMVVGYRRDRPVPGWLRSLDLGKRIVSRILLGDMPEARDTWLGVHGWGRRLVARHLFGVRLRDPECGLILAKRECFARMRIQSHGSFAWTEVAAKANHLGLLLAEAPVAARDLARPVESFRRDARLVFRTPDFGQVDHNAKPQPVRTGPLG